MTGGTPVVPGDPARVGGYRILSRLGKGGQGVVYLAEDRSGAHYALKVLRAEWLSDPRARQRLAQEVSAASQVSPFCTARLVEAVLEGPEPFLVTEYVRGPTLDQFVAERGTLSGTDLHRLAIGTATALVAIHQTGVVHRDLKPSNVILSPQGPRVIDFGISREQLAPVTMTSKVIGTPMYMAPEQALGESAGPPADLFSWASTVAFAATAQAPFAAPSLAAIVHRLTTMTPDLSGIEQPLSDLLGQCLAKDPAERPTAQQALLMLLGQPLPKKDISDPTGLLSEALAVATITAEVVDDLIPGQTSSDSEDDAPSPEHPGDRSADVTTPNDPTRTVVAEADHVPTMLVEAVSPPTELLPEPPETRPATRAVPPSAPPAPAARPSPAPAARPPSAPAPPPARPQSAPAARPQSAPAARPQSAPAARPPSPPAGRTSWPASPPQPPRTGQRPPRSAPPRSAPPRSNAAPRPQRAAPTGHPGSAATRYPGAHPAGAARYPQRYPVRSPGSSSRPVSDDRRSVIVMALIVLTVALFVVLGLIAIALVKSSRTASDQLGHGHQGYSAAALRAAADVSQPNVVFSKDCSAVGKLPPRTSSS